MLTADTTAERDATGPTGPTRPTPAKALAAAHLELIAQSAAVPFARQCARFLARDWDRRDLLDTAELVVSELVTNAVHAAACLASPVIWLSLAPAGDDLMIRVWDACGDLPVCQSAAEDAEHGRGLMLVEAVARDWGVYQDRTGKNVWALLA